MKTNSNQVIDQIIGLVNQLSDEEKDKLLHKIISGGKGHGSQNKINNLILEAPTWSDEDYENFKKVRQSFNSSRFV